MLRSILHMIRRTVERNVRYKLNLKYPPEVRVWGGPFVVHDKVNRIMHVSHSTANLINTVRAMWGMSYIQTPYDDLVHNIRYTSMEASGEVILLRNTSTVEMVVLTSAMDLTDAVEPVPETTREARELVATFYHIFNMEGDHADYKYITGYPRTEDITIIRGASL